MLVTVQNISGVVMVEYNSNTNEQTIIMAKKIKWRRMMKRKHHHLQYFMHNLIIRVHDYRSYFS